ncbi:MAG: restriction endonuclease subunit S [Desulfovibrio sp.]
MGSSKWEKVRLKDAAIFFSGGTPPKSNSEYWGGDIPWISAKSMTGNRYNDSELKLTEAGLKKGSRLAPKDATLLLVRGSMLHQRIPVGIATKDVAFNQDVKAIVPNKKFCPLYFYYCFAGREHELLSKVENTGIGAGKLDTDILHKVEFYCPPLPEQKAIAHILGSLDDKIELNRQMNETLEAMAQALFKSWFVDFDPVIDNALAAGNPIPDVFAARAELRKQQKKSPQSHLFPDAFEYTDEMVWIPQGWEIVNFTEFAKLDTTSVKPNLEQDKIWELYSIPAFDTNKQPVFELGEEIKSNKYRVNKASVLVSKLNPETERIWWVNISDKNRAICSTEFMQFVPNNIVQRAFVYNLIKSDFFQAEIKKRVTGSTGSRQRAQPKSVAVVDVLAPNNDLIERFSEITEPYKARQVGNISKNKSLSKLRDTLLPKLLSGELRIPDAEKLIKEA